MRYWLDASDKVRMVTLIIWLEEMSRYNADNPLGGLLEYLEGLNMPIACSPLHDRDTYSAEDVRKWVRRNIDPDTGEVREDKLDFMPKVGDRKKAHVHVIIESKNPLPVDAENGMSWCGMFRDYYLDLKHSRFERVANPDAMKRYLCHLDDTTKFRYDVCDVHTFGGIKMGALLREDDFAKINTFNCCLQHAIDKKLRYYFQLLRWAYETGNYEYISCVKGNVSAFSNYFSSQRQAREDLAKAKRAKEMKEQNGEG